MKRVLALTLISAFAAGPSVKWLCQHSCAAGHAVAETKDCHHSEDPAPAKFSSHDCDHTVPVALTAKRVLPESQLFVSMLVASPVSRSDWPAPSALDFADLAPTPPLASLVVPLRI